MPLSASTYVHCIHTENHRLKFSNVRRTASVGLGLGKSNFIWCWNIMNVCCIKKEIKPVFDIKEGWVILIVILLIKRGHLHTLRRCRYNVIFSCFSDSSPRSVGNRTVPKNEARTANKNAQFRRNSNIRATWALTAMWQLKMAVSAAVTAWCFSSKDIVAEQLLGRPSDTNCDEPISHSWTKMSNLPSSHPFKCEGLHFFFSCFLSF